MAIRRTCAAVGAAALLCVSPGTASADVVQDWNAIMMTTVSSSGNPFTQTRFAAIVELAVFEAVNAIEGDYESYLGTVTAPVGASAQAAAIQAAYEVLITYPAADLAALDASLASSLAAIPDGQAKDDGIAVGEAAAAALIAARSGDGSTPPQTYTPPSHDPGQWVATPPPGCPGTVGVMFHWQNVTPFGIESSSQFRSRPPPALTSRRYVKDYDEVKELGRDTSTTRPQDRTDVARFFAVASAAHVWNQAASQVATEKLQSLAENARMFALLNMAIQDGLVASIETKYHYVFWRPYTAIHEDDGNPRTEPDPSWSPLISTPCFPSYPSAHASASYAARKILERTLGGGRHATFTLSHPGIPTVTLDYDKFSQLTDDIDDARVYGGIHFQFDQDAGARQGRRVGSYTYEHNLRRVHGDHDDD
jgi:hypothetical protein